ncbi:hypothetical protein LTR84_001029 [Exophiala bonariae]|uniref:Major facilitator superfamily (MFS) profile domain-containing protein n=1 Tax=Exophiala bonariae TaxID=1690606 RepID=A0AAV9NUZ8_9EURO|nr:hypothetical protein LTR84_001029 [Exophiala bonariae]
METAIKKQAIPETSKPGEDEVTVMQEWDSKEESRIVRKLDFFLMPILVAGFFVLQLDRSNIGNALTSTLTKDLGITRDEVNAGNQLQIAAIVIFEIPSNIILQRVGASVWITFLAFAWGIIATLQAFCTNKGSFYATRFLLGAFEAGYIPGCQYILALFYRRTELAQRTAIFYVGNYLAAGTGSLMAAGILQLEGARGLAGWQWIFLIEGAITLAVAVVILFLLPKDPLNTVGLARIQKLNPFTDQKRSILHKRIIIDDPHKEANAHEWKLRNMLKALADIRLWAHMGINVLSLAPKGGLQLYSPSIIRSLGFDSSKANALNSVGNYGVIILSLLVSWISDRTRQRGLWCLVASAYSMIFSGVLFGLPVGSAKWTKYGMLMLLNSGNAVAQGLNDAWLSSNCKTPQQRSIGLAMVVMGSNLGGLTGQQLFRSSDAPRYVNGFLAILCLYAASMVAISLLTGLYFFQNRKLDRMDTRPTDADDSLQTASPQALAEKRWRFEM